MCRLRRRLRLRLWDRFVLSLHTAGAWRPGRSAATASADAPSAQIQISPHHSLVVANIAKLPELLRNR